METDDLRSVVEALDRAMSRCAATGALADLPALLACWATLVDRLALSFPPDLRRCPACGAITVRAARFCAGCCRTLDPLPALASA